MDCGVKLGFLLNIKTGFWKAEKDLDNGEASRYIKRVKLFTQDTADALYIYPLKALSMKKGSEFDSIITLQFALKRAIEKYLVYPLSSLIATGQIMLGDMVFMEKGPLFETG